MFEIIAGVDDDRQIFRRKDVCQSVSEFGAANSASQSCYFQYVSSIKEYDFIKCFSLPYIWNYIRIAQIKHPMRLP